MNNLNKKYGEETINKFADPKQWEIWPAPKGLEVLYQTFPEFTCLCPRSSYPDFAKVHLIIVPRDKVLELKALKLWLNSYREKKISHENATYEILQTLCQYLDIRYGFILMEYTPRGNLTTYPMREFIGTMEAFHESEIKSVIQNAHFIKEQLIKKVLNRVP